MFVTRKRETQGERGMELLSRAIQANPFKHEGAL